MDKVISSLLCCSVDSKDDKDDRYAQQQQITKQTSNRSKVTVLNGDIDSKTTSSPQKSAKQPPSSKIATNEVPVTGSDAAAAAAAVTAAKAAGSTAANTTDSTKTSNTVNTTKTSNTAVTAAVAAAKEKKDLDEDSVNETDTITNTNEESNAPATEQTNGATSANDILAQVDENGNPTATAPSNGHLQGDYDEDEDELSLDLTKLQVGQSFNPETGALLGKKDTKKYGNKKCLILDLDETLVHSSFKYLRIADFVIPVQIDNQVHHVYVIKRPGVDEFLEKVGKWFEVVVFTASVSKYGDPLLDKLDIHKSVHHRLFRDSCYNYQGNFIKNLSQIGRPLSDSIIIDNSPASYIFHPQHSIPISSWFSDTHDNELLDLLPFLEDISKSNVDDVGLVLDISL